jgi:hypothetical protein
MKDPTLNRFLWRLAFTTPTAGATYAKSVDVTRDKEGSYAMIYLPAGQAITIDLRKISGAVANAWWYDPRTGTASRVKGSHADGRPQRFAPPSSGPENDWVLVLDDASRKFPAPGRRNEESPLTIATAMH